MHRNSLSFINEISIYIGFLCIFSIPPILYAGFDLARSSGFFLSLLIILAMSLGRISTIRFKEKSIILIFSVSLILFIQTIFFYFSSNNTKPIMSVFLFICMVFSSFLFSKKISRLSDKKLISILLVINLIFIILGWISIFFGHYLPDFGFEKYTFPFTEQSHYALSVGMLSIIVGSYNRKFGIFFLLNTLLQSIIFPNLTFFIFFIIQFSVLFFSKNKIQFFLFFLFFFCIAIFGYNYVPEERLDYFGSRIEISSESSNQTALVYGQGLDDSIKSLRETNGLGLGFQMAGTDSPGDYGYAIYKISGNYLNREDGGFLAAKIVTEFGFLGVLFVFIYLYYVILSVSRLNSVLLNQQSYPFFLLATIGFFVEFFVRGVGYFSSQVFLIFTLFFLSKHK